MSLMDDLLAIRSAPPVAGRKASPDKDFTRQIEQSKGSVEVTIRDKAGTVNEGTARDFIESEGLSPDEWDIASWKKSIWGSPENPMDSISYTFKPAKAGGREGVDIDELLERLGTFEPVTIRPTGSYGFLVILGDMQFGKADGDGVEGTVQRTITYLYRAAELLRQYGELYDIGHVHIAWMGDHVEGFNSQGGANAWRTTLTLTEQIRLTRRVMLYALKQFAPLANRVTMAAVPGNHGEAVRFNGKGVTRYDDSHDTESLIAVADAAELSGKFGHVEFYTPDSDELTVMIEVAGTKIAHAHGHQWRPGKQFDWWAGQAFNRDSAMHVADVLLSGHLHHDHIERDGSRLFVGAPAMEAESTWWRHKTGTGGCPGLITAVVKDGLVTPIELVH